VHIGVVDPPALKLAGLNYISTFHSTLFCVGGKGGKGGGEWVMDLIRKVDSYAVVVRSELLYDRI
jgi:hypothetical protein